ncbi:MAG: hypothetical protein EOP02_10380 [Proteobacteria bacterium]|nr:MAG: hypothetical protein EOP02_10380 [Pseudomonadota bacterium]
METDQKTPGQALDEIGLPMPSLPLPDCTYADHSYPAYSRKRVLEIIAARSPDTARLDFLLAHGSRFTSREDVDHAMENGEVPE